MGMKLKTVREWITILESLDESSKDKELRVIRWDEAGYAFEDRVDIVFDEDETSVTLY